MTALAWPLVALAAVLLLFVWAWRYVPTSRRFDRIERAATAAEGKVSALAAATDAELTKFRNELVKFNNRTGGDAADRLLAQKAKAEAPKGPIR